MSEFRVRASLHVCAAVCAAMAAVSAACTGSARPAESGEPLVVSIGIVGGSAQVTGLVRLLSTEPLVSVDWEGRPEFRVAQSVTTSGDGRSLTVRLHPNLRFHSGDPVTAPTVRDLMLPLWIKTPVGIVGADAPDDGTLIIRLNRPHAFGAVDLSRFSIDDDTRPDRRTGPFRIVSLEPKPVLEPFNGNNYEPTRVARVEIETYTSHRAAWAAMLRGEVNFLHEVSREAIEFVDKGGDIVAYPLLRPYYVPLVFNVRHPILRRAEIRIALNEAIDREEIVRNGMRGHGVPVEGPFWPHHWAYPRGRYPAVYNPDAAKVRLDAAGLRVVDHGKGRAPSRVHFTCLLPQDDTRFERIALVVQRQLSAIGVDMEFRLVPQKTMIPRILSGDFEAFIFEMGTARTLGFTYDFWHSKGARAMSGYSGADAALDRMRLAHTEDEVRLGVSEVMRVMRANPPAAFLVMPREVRAADKAFQIPYDPDHDVFGVLREIQHASQMASAR